MTPDTITEVVKELVGHITPQGESNKDEIGLENLKRLCLVVDNLADEISDVARFYKDRNESSIVKMVAVAKNFIDNRLKEKI